jgi:hypothetical protein
LTGRTGFLYKPADERAEKARDSERSTTEMTNLYAEPREVTDLRDCYFYHTTEIPGHGTVEGEWDLRRSIERYLGRTEFRGKRVLDVGAASGFLSFYMEGQGAEVVSYDLSEAYSWDRVPFAGLDLAATEPGQRDTLRRLNNSYWLCHKAYRSRARMVHGTVYTLPPAIGPVDIAVFGSILLHVRDPFLALQRALALTKETVIVADLLGRRHIWQVLLGWLGRPSMTFLPEMHTQQHSHTWWALTPQLIRQFVEVLGFERTRVTYHLQRFQGRRRLVYTVVGHRTRAAA